MSEIIRMEYQSIEEMMALCKSVAGSLNDTAQKMKGIASTFEGGAFIGQGGEAFTEAIRTGLVPAIGKLEDKMQEIVGDLQGALTDLRDEDQQSAGRF
ncbi:MAG: WXG100 family type VII secretion target [Anaerolineaceae bacterium]|nr:WXG100 family type VII secretion target [Anaerolineaceae bacterium]